MKKLLYENGLSLAMFGLFLLFIVGHALTGRASFNSDQLEHGQAALGLGQYLASGHFLATVFENWESEFLQMGVYVLLTVFLRQRGSAESKSLDGEEEVDEDPLVGREKRPDAPKILWRGALLRRLYANSLSIALFALFLLSFVGHAAGGASEYNQELAEHGSKESYTTIQFLSTSRFWFESFQNWQSEFLSIGMLVVLSIYLRQQGSPESKPVAAAHDEEGK